MSKAQEKIKNAEVSWKLLIAGIALVALTGWLLYPKLIQL
jgi:hypothetical protein